MGALLALLWMVAGMEPLMVWVAGFPFLCLPLCLASSHPTPPHPPPALPTQPPLCFLVVIFSVFGGIFWSYCLACGISVSQPGIKPGPLEAES